MLRLNSLGVESRPHAGDFGHPQCSSAIHTVPVVAARCVRHLASGSGVASFMVVKYWQHLFEDRKLHIIHDVFGLATGAPIITRASTNILLMYSLRVVRSSLHTRACPNILYMSLPRSPQWHMLSMIFITEHRMNVQVDFAAGAYDRYEGGQNMKVDVP